MTPTPRDPGSALDPRAVEAAAEALHRYTCDCGIEDDEEYRDTAEVALTAAAPFLRAEGAAAAQAEVERLRAVADANWNSWEREAGEHARTLGLIGAPRTGEPLNEGEQRRYEESVVRGLQKASAEARAEGAAAERQRIAAAIRALTFKPPNAPLIDSFAHGISAAARIAEADPGTTAPTEGDDRD